MSAGQNEIPYLPDAEILSLRNRVEAEARPLLIEVLGQMM